MNIGQAAKSSGVTAKMIRYYESIGLLPAAARTDAGYRSYGVTDVHSLQFIRRARDLGFSLDAIAKLIALWSDTSRQSSDVKKLALAHVEDMEAKIAQMQAMADTLRQLAASCAGDDRPNCPILGDLENGSQAQSRG